MHEPALPVRHCGGIGVAVLVRHKAHAQGCGGLPVFVRQLAPGRALGPAAVLIPGHKVQIPIGEVAAVQVEAVCALTAGKAVPGRSALRLQGRGSVAAGKGALAAGGKTGRRHIAVPGPGDADPAHRVALLDASAALVAAHKTAGIGVGHGAQGVEPGRLGCTGADGPAILSGKPSQIDCRVVVAVDGDLSPGHGAVGDRAAVAPQQGAHVDGGVAAGPGQGEGRILHAVDHIPDDAGAVPEEAHIVRFAAVSRHDAGDGEPAAVVGAAEGRVPVHADGGLGNQFSGKNVIVIPDVGSIVQRQLLLEAILVFAGEIGLEPAEHVQVPGGAHAHQEMVGLLAQVQVLLVGEGDVGKMGVIVIGPALPHRLSNGDGLIEVLGGVSRVDDLRRQGQQVVGLLPVGQGIRAGDGIHIPVAV